MNVLPSICCGLTLLAANSLALAADQAKSYNQSLSPTAAIDGLAHEIFTQADKNHNDFLSKIEFARAREALLGQVQAWGEQGLIGKPLKRKPKAGEHPRVTSSSTAAGDKLARSNKVSLADFVLFSHTVLTEADENWRQMRASADAERKAIQTQRKVLNQQRRAGNPPGRTVFGIPF